MSRVLFDEHITSDPKRLKEQLNLAFSEIAGITPAVKKVQQKVTQIEQIVSKTSFTQPQGTPTFTPGSIPFAGTDGTLTQNNANLFWDNINLTAWSTHVISFHGFGCEEFCIG